MTQAGGGEPSAAGSSPPLGLGEAFAVQRRVVGALLLRELSSRFGRENMGFVWLFLEPALLGGTIGLVHHISGHQLPGGPNVFVFWVLGYIPYYLMRAVINSAPSAIRSNQTLLYHRRITILDIMISRGLLDGASVLGAYAGFTLFFGAAFGEWPASPGKVLIGLALMLGVAQGVALLIAAGSVRTELFDRITHLAVYLSLPISGAFYMVFWLPTEAQRMALWIPTVHCFELVRDGQFGDALPTTYDIPYLLGVIAVLNLLGMAALRHARRMLVV